LSSSVDNLYVVYFKGGENLLVEVREVECEAFVADARGFPLDSLAIGLA